MNREELRKLIGGTIVTIPTAFDDDFKLDLGRQAELTKWWVAQGLGTGINPLKSSAAMGEGPDLSDDEWPHLLRTVVNAAGPDAAVICGLQTKNTLHTIEDAKKAQDLGAIGLQIDLPIFHHSNQDDYVRFFTDISDAIDIGIMIYNTYWFGGVGLPSITAETMLRLADAEQVVAVKWDVPEGQDYDDMKKFAHIFNVIDNANQYVRCHKNGGRGYISGTIPAYPQHDLEIWQLLEAGRYEEAQAKVDHAVAALGPIRAKIGAKSGGYRFGKGLMAAVGQPAGPPRPPTLPMDEGEIAELKDVIKDLGWIA
jgi:4-hydroxy-tetrahydrodipicolinate synthase